MACEFQMFSVAVVAGLIGAAFMTCTFCLAMSVRAFARNRGISIDVEIDVPEGWEFPNPTENTNVERSL